MDIKKYVLNSQMDSYKRHVEQARVLILQAISLDISWYVAWSGGKDSTVLAHLCNAMNPGISVWSEKDDCDFPGELEYIKETAMMYGWDLDITYLELWDKIAQYNICEDIHSRGTALSDKYFYSAIAIQESQYDGVFLGLRKGESYARLMNFAQRGYIYRRKNGKYTCIPLANWTATDIFSYLIINEIPILDIYFKTKFVGSPENIRKSWMLPGKQARKGYCCWLKYYYPEWFARLASIYPEVKSYV